MIEQITHYTVISFNNKYRIFAVLRDSLYNFLAITALPKPSKGLVVLKTELCTIEYNTELNHYSIMWGRGSQAVH